MTLNRGPGDRRYTGSVITEVPLCLQVYIMHYSTSSVRTLDVLQCSMLIDKREWTTTLRCILSLSGDLFSHCVNCVEPLHTHTSTANKSLFARKQPVVIEVEVHVNFDALFQKLKLVLVTFSLVSSIVDQNDQLSFLEVELALVHALQLYTHCFLCNDMVRKLVRCINTKQASKCGNER